MHTNKSTIKRLMQDFTQPTESSEEILNMVIWEEDEFTPYEVLYLFQHLLGMKIRYKPYEKVAFILFMRYKMNEIAFVLNKLSFQFHIRKIDNYYEVYSEIKEKIRKAIELSQSEFTVDAETSIKERNVILPNYIIRFERAFECLEQQIQKNLGNRTDWPQNEHRADCFVNSYAIHIVSYIEHLLTLLYPFSDSYDAQIDLNSFVSQSIYKKIGSILLNLKSEDIQIRDKITKLIKYVRNPVAHGYLTRSYFGDVLIPDIGYVPMSYCNYSISSQNYPFFPVNLEHQYYEMREIKMSFDNLVEKLYPNAVIIIKSGLYIKCNPKSRQEYITVIKDSDNTKKFVLRELYKEDIMINMDW